MMCWMLAGIAFSGATVHAQEATQKTLGTFGNWAAYSFEENGGTVCYMAATPEKSEGKYTKRGDVMAMITHRPKENSKNVFSFMSGYGYKKGAQVEVLIDGKKYMLFTQNDMAWSADAAGDNAITAALQKGTKMTIKGESARGTKTVDVFNLKGSAKSYEAISKACGL